MIELDQRPGFYYVSVRDGGRTGLLAGPFAKHAEAILLVDEARRVAEQVNDRAPFYWFGTCRSEKDLGPGKLNERLGVAA